MLNSKDQDPAQSNSLHLNVQSPPEALDLPGRNMFDRHVHLAYPLVVYPVECDLQLRAARPFAQITHDPTYDLISVSLADEPDILNRHGWRGCGRLRASSKHTQNSGKQNQTEHTDQWTASMRLNLEDVGRPDPT